LDEWEREREKVEVPMCNKMNKSKKPTKTDDFFQSRKPTFEQKTDPDPDRCRKVNPPAGLVGDCILFGLCEVKFSSVVHHFDARNTISYVECPWRANFYKMYL
jgi:hypothetical protein